MVSIIDRVSGSKTGMSLVVGRIYREYGYGSEFMEKEIKRGSSDVETGKSGPVVGTWRRRARVRLTGNYFEGLQLIMIAYNYIGSLSHETTNHGHEGREPVFAIDQVVSLDIFTDESMMPIILQSSRLLQHEGEKG